MIIRFFTPCSRCGHKPTREDREYDNGFNEIRLRVANLMYAMCRAESTDKHGSIGGLLFHLSTNIEHSLNNLDPDCYCLDADTANSLAVCDLLANESSMPETVE